MITDMVLEQRWAHGWPATVPSCGHTTAGHVCALRQGQLGRCVPLASNVRWHDRARSESMVNWLLVTQSGQSW
jgi:hypothetical protein